MAAPQIKLKPSPPDDPGRAEIDPPFAPPARPTHNIHTTPVCLATTPARLAHGHPLAAERAERAVRYAAISPLPVMIG